MNFLFGAIMTRAAKALKNLLLQPSWKKCELARRFFFETEKE
jgi:hypothetical protein